MASGVKVFIETHGCQMNVSDSERVASKLASDGFEIIKNAENADVVLINTCSIREKASHKVFTRVGELNHAKQKPFIGVMGCVAQLEGSTIFERSSDIKLVAGTGALERVPALLKSSFHNNQKGLDLGAGGEETWETDFSYRHSPSVAYIPIIEGCNKFCTYCIVPFSRGRERSRSAQSVIDEILRCKEQGVKEVCLIGQNVNSYRPLNEEGLESIKGATPFSKLLRAVAATSVERVKFTTSYPRDFHDDIVSAIEENDNLCEWIHLPVQSGSDRILKGMKRGYTIDFYKRLVDRIRMSKRNFSLTTDIIVGFPDESDNDFLGTVDLVKYCEYESAYIFKYSSRHGTPASK